MGPDFDGIQNLLEFVLRTAPMTPSRAALPTLKQDAGQRVFEYDRNDGSQSPADHVRVVIPNSGGKVFARIKVTQ